MLSRLALRSVQNSTKIPSLVTGLRSASTATSEDSQRDLVNFPRRVRPIEPGSVRLGIFPEEWFNALSTKSGATGPYVFLASFGTFLVSKEYFVVEHDFYSGLALCIILGTINNKFGADIKNYLSGLVAGDEDKLRSIRQKEFDKFNEAIAEEEKVQWMASSYETLIEAKKESVALQLENAYRSRLQEAYLRVKERLDYQLETANVHRRMEQKHMVNWILDGVKKAITNKQEEDALKKAIADLNTLA
ncbi:ATP synthase subunit b, mitochondrial [Lepeophtheirus salmonis]|uniref:ATP synthase subunit b n=2 Tax=Lepeophtheirus salmonis TaxID=72036 RepID=C1BSJ8_LEPSM|nr:ATP synthase subunit b, mitochondrial-like [Lepeophtheirus salmonis]ACO12001.1 ATP synthase subunit b, mitochondrial precursor [Lepeophtheirus salmonis]